MKSIQYADVVKNSLKPKQNKDQQDEQQHEFEHNQLNETSYYIKNKLFEDEYKSLNQIEKKESQNGIGKEKVKKSYINPNSEIMITENINKSSLDLNLNLFSMKKEETLEVISAPIEKDNSIQEDQEHQEVQEVQQEENYENYENENTVHHRKKKYHLPSFHYSNNFQNKNEKQQQQQQQQQQPKQEESFSSFTSSSSISIEQNREAKKIKFVCLDGEMTGLWIRLNKNDNQNNMDDKKSNKKKFYQHKILEIAVILSDPALNDFGSYHGIRHLDLNELNEIKLEEWSRITHTQSGLLDAVQKSTKSISIIDSEIYDFILQACDNNIQDTKIIPIGMSISNDLKFIEKELPKFFSLLHYKIIELSGFQLMGKYYLNKAQKNAPPKIFEPRHRALPDARSAWNYFLYIKKLLEKIPSHNYSSSFKNSTTHYNEKQIHLNNKNTHNSTTTTKPETENPNYSSPILNHAHHLYDARSTWNYFLFLQNYYKKFPDYSKLLDEMEQKGPYPRQCFVCNVLKKKKENISNLLFKEQQQHQEISEQQEQDIKFSEEVEKPKPKQIYYPKNRNTYTTTNQINNSNYIPITEEYYYSSPYNPYAFQQYVNPYLYDLYDPASNTIYGIDHLPYENYDNYGNLIYTSNHNPYYQT